MKQRRPGLQDNWSHVVNSLQRIIPSYESASSRISLFADRKMRASVVAFAVKKGSRVLDLGSGPGTLSRVVAGAGGRPVLVDVSRAMLKAAPFTDRVQAAFECLPFREAVFDSIVSGFAVRDAHDLAVTLSQVQRVLKADGRFSFCDLGKPSSPLKSVVIAAYLKMVPPVIGLATAGRTGLGYATLYDTYLLVLNNSELASALAVHFYDVVIDETQMGGSIVAKCGRPRLTKTGEPAKP
jgi:ubiquinone/menaquinone biosynthesis C-methylase UbiE